MPEEQNQKRPSWGGTIFLIIIAIVLLFFSVNQQYNSQEQTDEQANEIAKKVSAEVAKTISSNKIVLFNQEVKAPNDFYGMGGSILDDLKEKKLISNPYTTDGYNDYEDKKIKVGLKGEFEVAAILMKIKVENDLLNFVSFNMHYTDGVYRGERSSRTTLNAQNMDEEAFFIKDNSPKEIIIGLRDKEKLSTTEAEYITTGDKYKEVVFWDKLINQPTENNGTVMTIYATIYDSNGNASNNAEIIEFNFLYTCNPENPESCEAVFCGEEYKKGSACLADKFGLGSDRAYVEALNKLGIYD